MSILCLCVCMWRVCVLLSHLTHFLSVSLSHTLPLSPLSLFLLSFSLSLCLSHSLCPIFYLYFRSFCFLVPFPISSSVLLCLLSLSLRFSSLPYTLSPSFSLLSFLYVSVSLLSLSLPLPLSLSLTVCLSHSFSLMFC